MSLCIGCPLTAMKYIAKKNYLSYIFNLASSCTSYNIAFQSGSKPGIQKILRWSNAWHETGVLQSHA